MATASEVEPSNRSEAGCPRIAVIIPCYNEAAAIESVVSSFRRALPRARIYVYDNASTDDTGALARGAGAIVRHEPIRGKGNVVRRMFADIEADCYIMVDGDGTYDATLAPIMVKALFEQNLDMVVGRRVADTAAAYRPGHSAGNLLFNRLHRWLFGSVFQDVFSGYRALSRRLVKSFPTMAPAFEIEAELTVHALDLRAPWIEIATPYQARPEGSESKLRTFGDGSRILFRSLVLFKEMHPAKLFAGLCLLFASAGFLIAIPVLDDFARTGQVPRFPSAILAASLEILAAICLSAGIVLDSIARRHRELKRLHYLALAAPSEFCEPGR